MPSRYDLHAHSTASDGSLSPAQLMQRAHAAGIEVMALTDHDTLDGLTEASTAAASLGMAFVPGVEVSVSWQKLTIHVLGLGVSSDCEVLQKGLAGLREFRDWRAQEIGRRLGDAGVSDAFEGARALSGGRLISRTHFARFLVDRGHAPDVRSVFRRFLVSGKPGHVSGRWASLEDAVSWIRTAGGDAVIAHPARYPLTRSKLRRLLGEFVEVGGAGLEVVSGSHSRDDYFTMAAHARDFGLRASAGSDYHGPEHPWIELGHLPELPDGCKPIWKEWQISH
ncbi:MAG: PHP domain-containing protein [Chromatiaceae bacterium]|nr:PHP domain-containing protein [Gammaproteobacteria bacterium]MCB1786082.1 PHP domain-containing protein [Gammaproteobacteria bacterium]MCP5307120.1 PHP domain-containing protein [Chromatiaceae bacterium]MCP5312299.1 PHP domain-containing protein [Chromatiaceae bacterium]